MTTILALLKSPKTLFMVVMAGAILVLLATMTIQAARYKVTEAQLDSERQKTAIQSETIKQHEARVKAIKEHDARLATLTAEAQRTRKAIVGIKAEGKCVQDENYYRVADSIADRFNRVHEDSQAD